MTEALRLLAERVEAASGPDRELDGEVEAAIENYPEGWSRASFIDTVAVEFHHISNGRVGLRANGGLDHARWDAPTYTASLDAAMSLVPKGWDWSVGTQGNTVGGHAFLRTIDGEWTREIERDAATPALALCAASLRARAAQEQRNEP